MLLGGRAIVSQEVDVEAALEADIHDFGLLAGVLQQHEPFGLDPLCEVFDPLDLFVAAAVLRGLLEHALLEGQAALVLRVGLQGEMLIPFHHHRELRAFPSKAPRRPDPEQVLSSLEPEDPALKEI